VNILALSGYLQLTLHAREDSAPVFNFFLKALAPTVYMILVATAFYALHRDSLVRDMARSIERLVFPWGSHTLGPMQVRTTKRISDWESVAIGTQRLREAFDATKAESTAKSVSRYDVIRMTLAKSNRDENYIHEVLQVLHALWAQVASEYRTEFETMYARPVASAGTD
jgi:hypothetical protein